MTKDLTVKEIDELKTVDINENWEETLLSIDQEKNFRKKIAQYKVIWLTINEMAERTWMSVSRIKKISASMKELLDDYDKNVIKKHTLWLVKILNEETWKDYNELELSKDTETLKVKSTLRKEMDDRYKNMLRLFGMSEERQRIEVEWNEKMSAILSSLWFKNDEK